MATLNERLMCQVMEVRVNVARHLAVIQIAADNCVDMKGAIDLVTSIDPDVKQIETVAGGVPDTSYRKIEDEWVALDPRSLSGVRNAVREQTPSV